MGLTASLPKKTPPDFFDEPQSDLSGLEFVEGDQTEEISEQQIEVSTAKQTAEKKYPKLPFEGYYNELLAQPASDFWMVVYGLPFQGKTTFSIGFAKYLAENMGNVLYVSAEQYDSEGLRQVIQNVGAENLNQSLQFSPSLEKAPPLNQFDFIFIDSANAASLTIEHLHWLRNKYKGKAFITILQSTKAGDFRGDQRWRHHPSIVVRIEDRQAYVEKNQYVTGEAVVLSLPELTVKENPESELNGKKKSLFGKVSTINATLEANVQEFVDLYHLLKEGETMDDVFGIFENQTERVNEIVRKETAEEMKRQKAKVKVKSVKWDHNEPDGLITGDAIFNIELEGTQKELEKVADVDQILFYEWDNQ
jgi:hypothetical protein